MQRAFWINYDLSRKPYSDSGLDGLDPDALQQHKWEAEKAR